MKTRQRLPPRVHSTRVSALPSATFHTRPFTASGTQHAPPPASAAPGFSFADVSVAGPPVQRAAFGFPSAPRNATGLPDHIKHGVERLSGVSLDDVSVHYDSPHPRRYDAHAYTQGREIHVSRGQERHLAHEAWHVVQQKRGRVRPTLQVAGAPVNDDAGLEREAESMGARAAAAGREIAATPEGKVRENTTLSSRAPVSETAPLQMAKGGKIRLDPKSKPAVKKGTPFTPSLREQIIEASRDANDGYITCETCGFQHTKSTYLKTRNGRTFARVGDGSFHVDHIHPQSRGGQGTLKNGRVLCGTCNTSRQAGNRIRKRGLIKYAGLNGGDRVHIMNKADYDQAKTLYAKKKGKIPLIPIKP